MKASNCRVGIIGAGTTGVFLASLLAREGYQVDLFEKAAQPRTDGCGILLVPSGLETLHQGNPRLRRELLQAGSPAKRYEFRNLQGTLVREEIPTLEEGEIPCVLIHRKIILETLLTDLKDLPSHCLHFNAEFKSLTQTDTGVVVYFTDGHQWEGDVLVGCDGIFSRVREFVVPGVEVHYMGDVVWRSVVPEQTLCPDGEFILYMRSQGIYANFFDVGNGYTHWGFFQERPQTATEVGRVRPEDTTIPAQELAKLPVEAKSIIEATPLDKIVTNFSYDIDPLPILHQGRVVLLGDAAHAKSPTLARGMTSGFEDAWALAKYLRTCDSIETALAEFEVERLPIVHEYQRLCRETSRKIRLEEHE